MNPRCIVCGHPIDCVTRVGSPFGSKMDDEGNRVRFALPDVWIINHTDKAAQCHAEGEYTEDKELTR